MKINKKGFTLIELLAVIAILAIVSVVATQALLPQAANARRDAFATDVNVMISAASDAMALVGLDSSAASFRTEEAVSSSDAAAGVTAQYCYTLQQLIDSGRLEKDISGYSGTITVKVKGNSNTYLANVKNSEFYVNTTGNAKQIDLDGNNNGVGKVTGSISVKSSCTSK